ncbi:MAG: tRNA pseudouridine(55) synthase TruB [Chloroflexi bacterium]|nr:tRNA pseudouridine(55) synthase TruB [Chloroflexota bacterium]
MLRGFINVDKPQGVTSFEVVRQVRRAAGTRKVGHAGTLDPNATGVLPVALGDATRLIDELVDTHKRYVAGITFGTATDTYDIEGDITAEHDASHLQEEAVREALAPFVGQIQQRPPAYSAVKRAGVTAYRAARAGTPLELEPRPVVVYAADLIAFDRTNPSRPIATVDVRCGKGFYVRSLAHELGERLRVGAHLGALRRTQVGPFTIAAATPLDRVVKALEADKHAEVLLPPNVVIQHWPSVEAGPEQVMRLRQGMDIVAMPTPAATAAAPAPGGPRVRCYDLQGDLVALLKPSGIPGQWHPYRVFASGTATPDARPHTDIEAR